MTSDYQRMLRGASLRVTAARLAVLRAVHDYPHASTETVCGAVREDLGKAVSLQAIYDALNALAAAGLVRPAWTIPAQRKFRHFPVGQAGDG